MSTFASSRATLISGRELGAEEAAGLMRWLIGGDAQEAEILEVLNALCDKGVTKTELVAFARALREKATLLDHSYSDLVDTCGTGGGRPTFNISTAAAFVAAGAGVKIAKHGNRSTTGLGSADVLEALGIRLGGSPETLLHQLETVGIVFLFAPAHHPAMRHVAVARKALGRRSVFNLLGPLANPASAARQLIGVYDPALIPLMAESVRELGAERAVLVHSDDGLDEVSPCTTSRGLVLWDGAISKKEFNPEDFGIEPLVFSQIQPGDSIQDCSKYLEEAINDIESPRARAILPSASVAIWLSGLEGNVPAAADRARKSIKEGHAAKKLHQLVETGSRL